MPTVFRTNNKILPANARAADVAERMVRDIIPVQQRRYYDAFRVQGIQCIHYSRLDQGRRCSCNASGKILNGLLNEEGKASSSTINQIINGSMSFEVIPYEEGYDSNRPDEASPYATVNKHQGVFDRVRATDGTPFEHTYEEGTEAFGDDGPLQKVDIDELLGDVDITSYGMSDVACPVCFGSGFVGGFAPFHSYRHVMACTDVVSVGGQLDLVKRPYSVQEATSWSAKITLPRGALAIESFKVWNYTTVVPTTWTIDGVPVTTDKQILAFCNGHPHLVQATFAGPRSFSHVEIQFTMSSESLYFEFPKRPLSADTSLLERMEPFQIVMSPNIPRLNAQDVIVESQLGKALVVQTVNPWQSRDLNVLGPECNVRVTQPQELYRLLPARGRVPDAQPSTAMVRDNVRGIYRT